MTKRFRRDERVIVVGGFHHGRRGRVITPPESWADKTELLLDTVDQARQVVWVHAYLIEPEAWEDR